MSIRDCKGVEITVDRLVGVTWSLLEDARTSSTEIDHQACGKYIELIAKVLLPKTGDGGMPGKATSLQGMLEALQREESSSQ